MLQHVVIPICVASPRHARLRQHQQQHLGRRAVLAAPAARESVASTAESLQQHAVSSSLQEQPLHGKAARFSASKQLVKQIPEAQRPLADYMSLPASQYSVLDARKIERIDDSTFRCYVGKLAFLGFSVEPVITVSVVVEERGCTIKLLSAKLQGSQLVEDLNKKFTAQMTNVVRWSATEDAAVKQLASTTTIEVVVQVPGWAGLVPVPSVEAAGSRVMQTTLNLMVPRFLEQLSKDYQLWASGDNSRKPLSDASL
eukprot:GHRQ01006339.1.p1 GENE.GHRQ01006339.1~~GHRQ01006339.1.p1  ORF type:complete len:256 (+),score=80.02 GHRQ01006339.1:207-974(+)